MIRTAPRDDGFRRWGSMSPPSQPIPGRPVPLRFLKTTASLRIVAGAARRPALFPQLFPIPDPGRHLDRQRESQLMREHTHLPAMVGFVRKHVAQHKSLMISYGERLHRPEVIATQACHLVSQKSIDSAPLPLTTMTRRSDRSNTKYSIPSPFFDPNQFNVHPSGR